MPPKMSPAALDYRGPWRTMNYDFRAQLILAEFTARSVPGFGFYDGLITRHILRELVPTMRHGDKGGRAFD